MLAEKIGTLAEKIRAAFADVPPPAEDNISPFADEESNQLVGAITGKDWRTLPAEFIEERHSQLVLLTPEAFRYYLPAYLLRGLEMFLDPKNYFTVDDLQVFHYSSMVAESTALSFIPDDLVDDHGHEQYQQRRYGIFNDEQMAVMQDFLDIIDENGVVNKDQMAKRDRLDKRWKDGRHFYR